MSKKALSLMTVFLIITLIIATGCDVNPRGAKVFSNNPCLQCHTIKGHGGQGGPDLSRVGGRRSRAFIVQQIKNSKLNNPDTNMPSFKDLPEQDINDLADYLSNLK